MLPPPKKKKKKSTNSRDNAPGLGLKFLILKVGWSIVVEHLSGVCAAAGPSLAPA